MSVRRIDNDETIRRIQEERRREAARRAAEQRAAEAQRAQQVRETQDRPLQEEPTRFEDGRSEPVRLDGTPARTYTGSELQAYRVAVDQVANQRNVSLDEARGIVEREYSGWVQEAGGQIEAGATDADIRASFAAAVPDVGGPTSPDSPTSTPSATAPAESGGPAGGRAPEESGGPDGARGPGESSGPREKMPWEVGLSNGKIPSDKMQSLAALGPEFKNHRLWGPAAESFMQMVEAARRDGVTIGITDSYRDYETQVRLAEEKGLYSQGGLAATPGTSQHGWGMAVDLDLNGEAQAWLQKHAHEYGFETIPREPWHWQWSADGASPPPPGGGSYTGSAGGSSGSSGSSGGGSGSVGSVGSSGGSGSAGGGTGIDPVDQPQADQQTQFTDNLFKALLASIDSGSQEDVEQQLKKMFPNLNPAQLKALSQLLLKNPALAAAVKANPATLQQLAQNPELVQQLAKDPAAAQQFAATAAATAGGVGATGQASNPLGAGYPAPPTGGTSTPQDPANPDPSDPLKPFPASSVQTDPIKV